jgi:hypothetical protein
MRGASLKSDDGRLRSQQTSIILSEGRIIMAKGMDRKKETKKLPKKKAK